MPRVPQILAHRWYRGLLLAALAGCFGAGNSDNYGLRWRFINNSSVEVYFVGTDLSSGQSADANVEVDGSQGPTTTSLYKTATIQVKVEASPAGHALVTQTATISVEKDKTTVITSGWDGNSLTVSSTCGASAPPIAAPGFEPHSNSCGAPTTWTLVGITGTGTGNWANQAASASGTLTFDVPQTVQEGTTVNVSATFSGPLTVNTGWSGYSTSVTVGVVDRGVPGLTVNNNANTGAVTGTKATSVTVTGSWIIPSNPVTLVIEAGGSYTGMTLVGATPSLIATYRKGP